MKNAKKWPLVLATVPLWPMPALLTFATLVRLQLGFWPHNGGPDPANFRWLWLLDVAVGILFLLAPAALLVATAAAIHAWYAARWDWRLLLTVVSFAALALWIHFDPGEFLAWWMD